MTVSHPAPSILARNLRQLADRLDDTGTRTLRQAAVLAARGWPTSVLGDGTNGSSSSSSTERAALNPGPFDDIDKRLRTQLRLLWSVMVQIHANLDTVQAHANDDDPIPAGTGRCQRCQKFVRPDGRRHWNRIQAGFCPACYRRWVRLGRPDRTTYIRTTDEDAA